MNHPLWLEVSINDQELRLHSGNRILHTYPISTSARGVGFAPGSYKTPAGRFEIAEKIGENMPIFTVFKGRKPIGTWSPDHRDAADLILTRILRLRGLDPENANTWDRYIYIHGTNHEADIGTPKSHGCIRMNNRDIIELFDHIPLGTTVLIHPKRAPNHTSTTPSAKKNQKNITLSVTNRKNSAFLPPAMSSKTKKTTKKAARKPAAKKSARKTTAKKATKKAAKKPAAKKPAAKRTKKAVVKKTAKKAAKKPAAKKTARKATAKKAKKAAKKPAVKKTAKKAKKTTVKKATRKPAAKKAKKAAKKPAAKKATRKPAAKKAKKAAKKPAVKKTTRKPTAKKAKKAAKKPATKKATKKSVTPVGKKNTDKGKRYTPAEKKRILAFVEKVNKQRGRGGQSAASAKYGVSVLTISAWRKKGL